MKWIALTIVTFAVAACGGGSSSGGGASSRYDGVYEGTARDILVENGSVSTNRVGQLVENGNISYLNSGNSPGLGCTPLNSIPVQQNGLFEWNYSSTCPISNNVCTIAFSGNGFIEGDKLSAKGREQWNCQSSGNFTANFNTSVESIKTNNLSKSPIDQGTSLRKQYEIFSEAANQ